MEFKWALVYVKCHQQSPMIAVLFINIQLETNITTSVLRGKVRGKRIRAREGRKEEKETERERKANYERSIRLKHKSGTRITQICCISALYRPCIYEKQSKNVRKAKPPGNCCCRVLNWRPRTEVEQSGHCMKYKSNHRKSISTFSPTNEDGLTKMPILFRVFGYASAQMQIIIDTHTFYPIFIQWAILQIRKFICLNLFHGWKWKCTDNEFLFLPDNMLRQ